MEQENKKAIDNALFKKLEQIAIKMPSDPLLYKEDVENYKEMFKVQFQKIQGDTMKKSERFGQLLIFLAKSVRFFPEQLGFLPTTTMSLMNELGKSLHPYNRKKCISAVMILRAKNILYPISTIQFLLKQFNIEDKQLRKILYKYILNDIRRMNKHHKNNQINQQLKKFISQYITKYSDKTAQKSLQLMIDLYKKNIWTDNRTVNIIAQGCSNASPKIRLLACYFLLTTTEHLEEIEESDSDNEVVDPSQIKWKKGVRRHTKNKQKKLEKEKRRAERRIRKKQIVARTYNFMPIDLIYSPQDFAQKLFNLMNQKTTKFSHKIIYMGLISRIIWRHKLIMLPFYGALQKYMDPRQKQAPKILAYFAQSVHDLVPEDQIEPIIKHIIETFVNDKCSQFTMTIGLNTIRQIYSKFASIITQQAMIYLCTYYEYKNKNVSKAAKSVINLVRQINPYLLQKKFRGKINSQPVDFMKQAIGIRIRGAQLLGEDQGKLPIQMDRILSDQDFKEIRKLLRKQQEQEQWVDIKAQNGEEQQQQQQQQLQINSDEFRQQNQDEEIGEEDEDDSELSSEGEEEEGDDEEMEEIEWGDEEGEEEEEVEGEEEGDDEDQEEDQIQEEEENQQDDEQLQFDSKDILEEFEELSQDQNQLNQQKQVKQKKNKPKIAQKTKLIQKTQKPKQKKNIKAKVPAPQSNLQQKSKVNELNQNKNKKIKKNAPQVSQSQHSSSQYESEEDQNPHGFIDVGKIAFYKRSKTQIKAQKRRNPQAKEVFKHKPKQKKGGSTNRQKNKLKPIMMVRAKKNKLKLREKQCKIRIKNLKNQLGKVRSGKQAKKLRSKIIKK